MKKAITPPAAPKAEAAGERRTDMGAGATIPYVWGRLDAAGSRIFHPTQQANERCLEMLVQAARSDRHGTFPLVTQLGEVFRALTPEARARAAHKAFLLVDMQFGNEAWWHTLKAHPTRTAPLPSGRGSFPRASAVQLGRAILILAWHSVRADANSACLLGMSVGVSAIISGFSLTDLDRIVDRRFRHVRPRWEDRPAVWRALLLSAQTSDVHRTRDVNLRALQLITGELIAAPTDLH